ncbi:uncharacterized protein MEPE_05234 [Melanopsichium pennsylvanicum]|uniref:Uncharacterized protein n=1 Tax=Melanopsichium pennsylvanicum TaxID=63383 RepID=A0AAJ4XPQ5_9BASI|nr:uncharacterized protein MEPE_05234 [Melanopsichium pennsylvanicum]
MSVSLSASILCSEMKEIVLLGACFCRRPQSEKELGLKDFAAPHSAHLEAPSEGGILGSRSRD